MFAAALELEVLRERVWMLLRSVGEIPFYFSSRIHPTERPRKSKMSPTSVHVCPQIYVSTSVIFQAPPRSTSMQPQMHTYLSSSHIGPLRLSSREVPLRVVCIFISYAVFLRSVHTRAARTHTASPHPAPIRKAAGTVYAETRTTVPLHNQGQTPFGLAVGSLFPSCTQWF